MMKRQSRALACSLIFVLAATLLLNGHREPARASVLPQASGLPRAHLAPLVLIMMENRSYKQIIGSPLTPYETALAAQYRNFTNMFSAEHLSQKDYFDVTSGINPQDSPPYEGFKCSPNHPRRCQNPYENIVDQLEPAGYTWKSYVENYKTPGFCDLDTSIDIPYEARYVPWLYYTDVNADPARCANIVSTPELQSDIDNRTLPDFSLINPNAWDNSHIACIGPIPPCPGGSPNKIAQGDSWLSVWVPQLIDAGAEVVLTWDESSLNDDKKCCQYAVGGHIPTIVAGNGIPQSVVTRNMDTYGIFKGLEYRFFGTGVQLLGNQPIMNCTCTRPVPL